MVKIKTSLGFEKGKVRATSYGNIKFNDEGIGEVENQEIADALTLASPSLHSVGEDNQIELKEEDKLPTKVVETTEAPPVTEVTNDQVDDPITETNDEIEKTNEESEDEIEDPNAALKAELNEMNMAEIREYLEKAGIDKAEYSDVKYKGKDGKPALIEFVISKVNE